ncbi:hypothetical protein EI94DRAFT_1055688 [Lactarius quietus]|nr:hypothetical protein EI94DRAFT_1055688 [Lactarius quietus]
MFLNVSIETKLKTDHMRGMSGNKVPPLLAFDRRQASVHLCPPGRWTVAAVHANMEERSTGCRIIVNKFHASSTLSACLPFLVLTPSLLRPPCFVLISHPGPLGSERLPFPPSHTLSPTSRLPSLVHSPRSFHSPYARRFRSTHPALLTPSSHPPSFALLPQSCPLCSARRPLLSRSSCSTLPTLLLHALPGPYTLPSSRPPVFSSCLSRTVVLSALHTHLSLSSRLRSSHPPFSFSLCLPLPVVTPALLGLLILPWSSWLCSRPARTAVLTPNPPLGQPLFPCTPLPALLSPFCLAYPCHLASPFSLLIVSPIGRRLGCRHGPE